MSSAPYGPASASIRRFLVQLAALGPVARAQVVQRFHDVSSSREYHAADAIVGDTIERSARTDARDALGGPFMALMRPAGSQQERATERTDAERTDAERTDAERTDADDLGELDRIAEPALGVLLALLVRDLIGGEQFSALYAPFEGVIPSE